MDWKDNPEKGKETANQQKQNKTKPRNCKDVDPVQASGGLLTFRLPCSLTLDEAPVSLCFRSKVWDWKHPTDRTNVIDFYLSKDRQLVYFPILLNTCLLVIYENIWWVLIYLLLFWVLSSYSRSFKDPSPRQAFRLAGPRCVCVHAHSSPGWLALGVFACRPAVQAGWP